MNKKSNQYNGRIRVSPKAIASIAYNSAIQSYGVVGLAPKSFVNGITNYIVKDPTHGIEVTYKNNTIMIDIYIVVEYGIRIQTVANEVATSVRYHVEKALGTEIDAVNVHIQGLRISQGL